MKARETAKASFRKTVATLRVLCPTNYPVRVSRMPLPDGLCGDTSITVRGKRAYKIRVSTKMCHACQIETLIHEWAHAMTWSVTHERHNDHGAHFGVAYAEAYQAAYD